MSAVLEVIEVSKAFGGLQALDRVSLTLQAGEILSVIGPNGAGKTTLLGVLSGLLRADSGKVRFLGVDITHLAAHRVAAMGMGRTFQSLRPFPTLTVYENLLAAALHAAEGRPAVDGAAMKAEAQGWRERRYGRRTAQARRRVEELLSDFELEEVAWQFPTGLPYGVQRRVEFARALAGRPHTILLDEPAAGMGPEEAHSLKALIRRVRAGGVTVLLVEHHMEVVMDISDRVVVLNFGRKIAEGPPEVVRRDPAVIEAYLGSDDDGV